LHYSSTTIKRNFNHPAFSDQTACDRGGCGCGSRFDLPTFSVKFVSNHTANICFYIPDSSYQPNESLVPYDPATHQPLQYSACQSKPTPRSNTWVNPTARSQNQSYQGIPSAMVTNPSAQENGNSNWIQYSGASFHVTGNS